MQPSPQWLRKQLLQNSVPHGLLGPPFIIANQLHLPSHNNHHRRPLIPARPIARPRANTLSGPVPLPGLPYLFGSMRCLLHIR